MEDQQKAAEGQGKAAGGQRKAVEGQHQAAVKEAVDGCTGVGRVVGDAAAGDLAAVLADVKPSVLPAAVVAPPAPPARIISLC